MERREKRRQELLQARDKVKSALLLVEQAKTSAWQSVTEIAKYVKELERGSLHQTMYNRAFKDITNNFNKVHFSKFQRQAQRIVDYLPRQPQEA